MSEIAAKVKEIIVDKLGVAENEVTAAASKGMNWAELRPQLRKAGRWHAETY